MIEHQRLLLAEIEKMDLEVQQIVSLIQNGLPDVTSDIYLKAEIYDRHPLTAHPINRLSDYRILAGRMATDLSRLENITSSLRRRIESVSQNAQELLKLAAWNPDMMREALEALEKC